MIGLKKEQALDMAKKLGFKDKLADEVCYVNLFEIKILFFILGSRSNS
jgi:hypothetical protein